MFAGTSNSLDFLPLDRAGNRRFLPIMVDQGKATKHILEDETEARAYIDQMWAEAMVIYRSGDFRLALPGELEEEARSRPPGVHARGYHCRADPKLAGCIAGVKVGIQLAIEEGLTT